MTSLGDQLAHLSLEIEDRTKSVELLQQLLKDQGARHEKELASFEKEQEEALQKLKAESKEGLAKISGVAQSLIEKKRELEGRLNELTIEKEDAERTRKKNLDRVRRDVADTKESAHKQYEQERCQREKAWLDGRVSEIHKLTWKGIQPNVERLARKHKEKSEEIKLETRLSKQKLELQCENNLSERIQAFQRSEQQSNACITQGSDFANLLLREQNEHAMNLMKLKENFMQEEESKKKMHSLQLETLAKEHDVALSKVQGLKSAEKLAQQLSAEKDARRQLLESRLERVSNHISPSKAQWEESWAEASASRVEKKNKQKMDDLLQWRKREIDGIIRRSILEQARQGSHEDGTARLTVSHEEKVAALNESLNKYRADIKVTKDKIAKIISAKARLNDETDLYDLSSVELKLADVTNKLDRKRRQHGRIKAEVSDNIEQRIQSITLSAKSIEQELFSMREKLEEELSNHQSTKDQVMREHETALDNLENYAAKRANDIDARVQSVHGLIEEQKAYLSRAQDLLSTRYNAVQS